jgi:hypothetical protein
MKRSQGGGGRNIGVALEEEMSTRNNDEMGKRRRL